ncbi:MAG: c-type cytochrome [Myxococcota bacterium]
MRAAGTALLCTLGLGSIAPPAAAEAARILYMLECQGCHRPDGSGWPGAVPSLRNSIGRFLTVPGGREFLVRVPGSAQSPLSDAELAEVLNWMIRSFGPEPIAARFEPYRAEEVQRYRRSPLTDVESVRRTLLEQMRTEGDG